MGNRGAIVVGVILVAGLIGGVLWWRSGETARTIAAPELANMDPQVAKLIEVHLTAARAAPDDTQRRWRLGLACEANGLHAHALRCYEQVVQQRPEDRDAWYRLARSATEVGDLAAGIEAMERATELDPRFAEGFALRGLWLVEAGRLDKAAQAFTAAVALEPTSEMAWLGQAQLQLQRGRADDAISIIRTRGLLERPNRQYAWRLLARALRQRGETNEAADALTRAGETQPRWPDLHAAELDALRTGLTHRKAEARRLREEGDLEGALRLLQALERDYPGEPEVLETLATCYLEMGRAQEAVEKIERVLAFQPGAYAANLVAANAWLALAPAQPEGLSRALAHAETAVRVRPSVADPHLLRARVLTALDRRDAAIDALLRAADLDGRDAAALNQAGLLSWEVGRHTEAFEAFRRARERDPSSATPLAGQALALTALGRAAEAEALLDAAAQRRQDHPELIALAHKQLRALGDAKPAPAGPPNGDGG